MDDRPSYYTPVPMEQIFEYMVQHHKDQRTSACTDARLKKAKNAICSDPALAATMMQYGVQDHALEDIAQHQPTMYTRLIRAFWNAVDSIICDMVRRRQL